MFYKTPLFLRALYPDAVWNKPSENTPTKCVYLTFDDGPTPDITEWVLDILNEKKIKSTFFCVGKNIEKHSHIFQRIIKENHSVGNHTYSHFNGWKKTKKNYINDVDRCNELCDTKIFRPPYGKLSFRQYLALKKKYQIVFWDILSNDFNINISPSMSCDNIKKNVKDGSIIVFHDSVKAEKNLRVILPEVIDFLKSEKFIFLKI